MTHQILDIFTCLQLVSTHLRMSGNLLAGDTWIIRKLTLFSYCCGERAGLYHHEHNDMISHMHCRSAAWHAQDVKSDSLMALSQ